MSRRIVAMRPPLFEMLGALLDGPDIDCVEAPDTVPEHAAVLLQTAMHPLPADAIEALPDSVGLIANLGVGYDNIDLDAARARGIAVSNTPVVTEDTADLTFALLLAAARRMSCCERLLRTGQWQTAAGVLGARVHGKVLGIVGFGAIGQAVARRARGFGMELLYHGPRRKADPEEELQARYEPELETLLGESDFVSLNCPLTAATRHLINADTLGAFKPNATLVNTGRGALIDEAALVQALREKRLGAVGLDVFEFEPQVSAGLLEFDNATLLPHIGSATGECRTDIAMRGIGNVRRFLERGAPLDRVA